MSYAWHERSVREPVTRGHRSKAVYTLLKEEILDLALLPGAPLNEIKLAERFKTSRTPVRHALERLSLEGLVTHLPCRSTVVSQVDFLNLAAFFDAYVLIARTTARLAATSHQNDDLITIRTRNDHLRAASAERDMRGIIAANAGFHLSIARAGGNTYYTSSLERLLNTERRILHLCGQPDAHSSENHSRHHDAIITAVAARDVLEAEHLARQHAEEGVEIMQRKFQCWHPLAIELGGSDRTL